LAPTIENLIRVLCKVAAKINYNNQKGFYDVLVTNRRFVQRRSHLQEAKK